MSKLRPFDYDPPENGDAMAAAREETGLEKEIALLRVKLKKYVDQGQADIGLILAVVNALGRALLALARLGTGGPEANHRLLEAMKLLGSYLQLENPLDQEDSARSPARRRGRSGGPPEATPTSEAEAASETPGDSQQ
jgi:hypothetical protein